MKEFEITRIKEVGKKTIADFVRSETGSVGIKNAATIGAVACAFALSESVGDAGDGPYTITLPNGTVISAI